MTLWLGMGLPSYSTLISALDPTFRVADSGMISSSACMTSPGSSPSLDIILLAIMRNAPQYSALE